MATKADTLARLQRDILSMQGHKSLLIPQPDEIGLDRISQSFPNGVFPFAALHEVICSNQEEATVACAFVACLLSQRMRRGGVALWISTAPKIFPPALSSFGVQPDQVIFLHLKKEKEISWAVEEALKCNSLVAVVGEMSELSFTASRRFQLAIEQSGVACFAIRKQPKNLSTTAVTRWQIKPIKSSTTDDLPGVGHPRWKVELLKVRHGKPGSWEVEWVNNRLRFLPKLGYITQGLQRKTG